MPVTRREFVCSTVGAAASAAAGAPTPPRAASAPTGPTAAADAPAPRPAVAGQETPPRKGPVVIASANGTECCNVVMELLGHGSPIVNAVVAGVTVVEDDPNDHSVGLGGIPNEDGVVELDASVMDGRTHKAGAVAALQRIRNAAQVALVVLRRTDHVLLVGDGARRFALAHGFKEEELLTDEARRIWLKWKESMSTRDDWLSDEEQTGSGRAARYQRWLDQNRIHGTIHCSGLDADGNLAGVTTTSGLGFKIPGRVGDSPIIGAGLYVDNDVGAAGSTGRGEANLQNCSSFMVVEFMRQGRSPQEACLAVLQRIADKCEPRLRNDRGEPAFDLKLYALARDGRAGGASMRGKAAMICHDGSSARPIDLPGLFAG